ncbi:hypothetical protein HGA88_04015 [Candidatus Roizmanbacteria bacterium]|nr:hypothetical protein [Candidatus Roizmanbacteria bacterium]
MKQQAVIPKKVLLVCDITYFKRGFGVMVAKDWWRNTIIARRYLEYETVQIFTEMIEQLQKEGWRIMGIVVDGRRGMLEAFPNLPIQIVTRYLT